MHVKGLYLIFQLDENQRYIHKQDKDLHFLVLGIQLSIPLDIPHISLSAGPTLLHSVSPSKHSGLL